jgi:HAD superfamily hydrolase (TIGR01509 family)
MTLRAALFDFDGTLVDSEGAHLAIWRRILAGFDLELDLDEYKADYAGTPAPKTARMLAQRHRLPTTAEALACSKSELTREHLAQHPVPLQAHALQALDWCRGRGLAVALVTGSPRDEIAPTLQHWALRSRFDVIVTRDDVSRSKPDPESYQLALERLGVSAAEAVAFEDTHHGCRSAIAAGVACLVVPTPYSAAHDFTGAAARVDSLRDAIAWLQGRHPH